MKFPIKVEEYVKGECFENIRRFFERNPDMKHHVKIMHGVATGRHEIEGVQYGHAWIVVGNNVIDPDINVYQMEHGLYKRIGCIDHIKEYSYYEAWYHVIEHGHWGPWDETIMEFTEKAMELKKQMEEKANDSNNDPERSHT